MKQLVVTSLLLALCLACVEISVSVASGSSISADSFDLDLLFNTDVSYAIKLY